MNIFLVILAVLLISWGICSWLFIALVWRFRDLCLKRFDIVIEEVPWFMGLWNFTEGNPLPNYISPFLGSIILMVLILTN